MKVTIISAMTKENVIGKNNDLPWRIPKEWAHFKKMTVGKPAIMGRNSYEAIQETGLPGRDIIVLSRTIKESPKYKVARSIKEALELANYAPEVMICGGTEVYRQFLDISDEMILSIIDHPYTGDTYFPKFDHAAWNLKREEQREGFKIQYFEKKT